MTATPDDLPEGVCVCGLDIPDTSPSDWACGEPCQSAWLMHHANPDYPHPRQIRESAERRAAERLLPRPAAHDTDDEGRVIDRYPVPSAIPDHTEVEVDGQGYTRIGGRWHPVGPWQPLERAELAEAVRYHRWCPRCNDRRPTEVHTSTHPGAPPELQVCTECGHAWPGRPLIGVVETRGEPWPGIRVRLTDGHRSTTMALTDEMLARHAARGTVIALLDRMWLKLERQLGAGMADQDRSNPQRQVLAARRRGQVWDNHVDYLHADRGLVL